MEESRKGNTFQDALRCMCTCSATSAFSANLQIWYLWISGRHGRCFAHFNSIDDTLFCNGTFYTFAHHRGYCPGGFCFISTSSSLPFCWSTGAERASFHISNYFRNISFMSLSNTMGPLERRSFIILDPVDTIYSYREPYNS
jgi:hypothetical protein